MLFIGNTYNLWDRLQKVCHSNEQKGETSSNSGKLIHKIYWHKPYKRKFSNLRSSILMVLNLAHDQGDPSVLVVTFHYLTAQSKENITIHKWLNNASRRVFKVKSCTYCTFLHKCISSSGEQQGSQKLRLQKFKQNIMWDRILPRWSILSFSPATSWAIHILQYIRSKVFSALFF